MGNQDMSDTSGRWKYPPQHLGALGAAGSISELYLCTALAVPKAQQTAQTFCRGWRWEELSQPRCELSKVSLNCMGLLPNKKHHCLHIVFICSSTLVLAPSRFSSQTAG